MGHIASDTLYLLTHIQYMKYIWNYHQLASAATYSIVELDAEVAEAKAQSHSAFPGSSFSFTNFPEISFSESHIISVYSKVYSVCSDVIIAIIVFFLWSKTVVRNIQSGLYNFHESMFLYAITLCSHMYPIHTLHTKLNVKDQLSISHKENSAYTYWSNITQII